MNATYQIKKVDNYYVVYLGLLKRARFDNLQQAKEWINLQGNKRKKLKPI